MYGNTNCSLIRNMIESNNLIARLCEREDAKREDIIKAQQLYLRNCMNIKRLKRGEKLW